MIFLIHSETGAATVDANLGLPEYSYYFVLKAFRPVLERLGVTMAVHDLEHEPDRIFRNAAAHGEDCVFLSFSPPHRTFVPRECPTIPVFAWEFDTIPTEAWGDEPRDDWRVVLGQCGRAITHSRFAARAVRKAMGNAYDITSLPAPVWDDFAPLYDPKAAHAPAAQRSLTVRGRVFDTRKLDLSGFVNLPPGVIAQTLPEAGSRNEIQPLQLDGVIYTSIFSPVDGRKNYHDMLSAFCWALRDRPDATLVFKLTHRNCDAAIGGMLKDLARLMPFRCRVVIIDGYLPDDSYSELTAASHFAVNASYGEGQCLPLMEYMSAGKPAVAPFHTSTRDYLTPQNAFLVSSSLEPGSWPHDPRRLFRTRRHRIDFDSLAAGYAESYRVAAADPARYAQMSEAAHEGLRPHCSGAVIAKRLAAWLAPRSSMALTA